MSRVALWPCEPDDNPGPDIELERRIAFCESYASSEQVITDALDYLCDGHEPPGALLELLVEWYCQTARFDAVVDDAMAGEPGLW